MNNNMMAMGRTACIAAFCTLLAACGDTAKLQVTEGVGPQPRLPEPNPTLIPTVHIAPAKRWSDGQTPTPASGLRVNAFAQGLDHPRWLLVLPNGDVLVAEAQAPDKGPAKGVRAWVMGKVQQRAGARGPSANRVTLLRDADGDGVAEIRSPLLEGVYSPFGMTLIGETLYVAHADALWSYRLAPGTQRVTAPGTNVADLPARRNHHWTKNVIAGRDGTKLYVTVGSNSNVAENGMQEEEGRAAIWEYDVVSGKGRLFATGLRNPNGMDWNPDDGRLWTVVNERDEIGSDLVPDYLTSVQDGGFYGWPYSYYGQHVDERVKPPRPDLVAKAIAPDYALGAHVAALGLVFVPKPDAQVAAAAGAARDGLQSRYANGAFIGLHGSWNRRPRSGYEVVFVPFIAGKPAGMPQMILSGFVDAGGDALGRPVGVAFDRSGALLVADDVGNTIWRVSAGADR